jgi:hypothetical protein
MEYKQEKRRYISFCGSYCPTCDWFTGNIRKKFKDALNMLKEYKFKKQLSNKVDIENLRQGLEILASTGICSGCKAEVAESRDEDRCSIRQCCSEKGYDLCSECPEFPCKMLKSNQGVIKFKCIENLQEIKEHGLEQWIDKQWNKYLE